MKKALKWIGWSVGAVVTLAIVGVATAWIVSNSKLARTYAVTPVAVEIPTDEASLSEGQRLYTARGCADCHGLDGAGKIVVDDPAIGRIAGTNVTPAKGSAVEGFTDEDWVRAIRHGVKRDGSSVVFMPVDEFNLIGDRELGQIIAYMKQLKPVERAAERIEIGPLAHILNAFGVMTLATASKVDHAAARAPVPEPAPTVEFGQHLALMGCVGCHGAGLSGGPMPGMPPSIPVPLNITFDEATGLGSWTRADFDRAMREGRRPDGAELNAFMPWKNFALLTDTEMDALWAYLQTVPKKPFGQR